ncbi:MAG: hypothetical protein WC408_06555, partial [Candidatus Micrarchaeia archaeon]
MAAEDEMTTVDNVVQEATADVAEVEEVEDAESPSLPFPNARVVKIIKENLKREHQIKRDVKVGANELAGQIISDI